MRLESFIAELLYDHDCVVLPDFGGLVANYRSARLNRKSHVISPPSKHIGFNRNLKSNDGLLASHVSSVLGLNYKEAAALVEKTIAEYQTQLNTSGRLMLDKIGVFFKDKGGQLQFIPDDQENFLLSSFGLSPVQLKWVEMQKETVEEKQETPVIPLQVERRRMSGWKIAAAIALPVMLSGAILLRSSNSSGGEFNFTSLNPFHKTKLVSTYDPTPVNNHPEIDVRIENQLPAILDSASKEVRYDFVEGNISEDGIRIRKNKLTAVAISTDVKKEANAVRDQIKRSEKSGRYALIGGAFQVEENAKNFLDKLKADGFDAEFAGKKDGLQLVAYGYFSTREEARQALKNIKESGGHAWIRSN